MANGKANKEKKQKKDSKRNERATPAAGSTPGKSDGGPLHRGLIVHNKFVDLILAETKTLEIRNQFLRCVPEGGEFYLLRAFEKGAGRNLHGQTCLEIAAKLIFKGNHFISHDDFDSFYDKHRVPSNAYASMRKGWKSDKGGCVAWEIEVDSVINPPRYLPSGSQEVWYNFTWDSTFEHKDDVPLKTRTKRQNDGMKQTSISDSLVKGGHEQAQPDANPDAPATVAGTEAAPAKIKKEHVLEPRPRVQGTTTEKSTSISSSSKRCPSPVKGPHPAHVEGESERRSLPGDQLLTHQGVLNATRLDEEKCLFPPESSEKTTKSLMHALDFYDSFLDEVVARTEKGDGHRRNHAAAGLDHATCTLDQLADWLETTSHSSAFSGIASPETALMGLYRAVQRRLPSRQIDMPRLTSFVEWDSECQQELMTLCKGLDQDSCIFSDIAGFFRDDIADLIKGLEQKPTMAFEILAPLLCSRKAMKRRAWCLRHQKECFLQTSDAHTAGSSCTAHSKQGLGKAFSDKNAIHFLAWCGLRLEVGEKEITLENVEEFPTDALERLMSPMYFIEAIKMDPRFFGFPIARGRKYHRLRNKAAALMELSPFSRFNKRFFRLVHWSWREFAFMHMFKDGVIPTEFEAELQWARSRKLSMIRTFANSGHESVEDIDRIVAHYGAQEVSDAKDMICALGGFQEQPFLASLNANELKMRGLYAEKAPGEAWQLNQNPGAGHGMHSTLFWMHTLIHNCGLIWVDEVHQPEPHETSAKADFPGCERACSRWLFGTECLCLQGFPVHPDFSDFFTSSFHFERQRKPRSICAQAGNSMHVVCPFLCHLHSAVCWRQPGEYNRIIGEIALFREAALLKRKQISSKSACVPDKEKGADGKRPKKRVKGKQPDPPQRI